MTYYVYILFSKKLNRYYTGSTNLPPEDRLKQHNEGFNDNGFTTKGIPWVLFLSLECKSREQARNVEFHIKRMKSRKYIENLKLYQELCQKLLNRYQG